ncbi:MAG: hypothetical protein ABEI97_00735 [Candidatus Nanohaloarchaea archaeon]
MHRAGITPVVALVIVLFMTVATAGGAYLWFSSIIEQQQEAVDRELRSGVSLRDVRCTGDTVTVAAMNTGERKLSGGNFSVFLYTDDGELVAEASHRMSAVDFQEPGSFGTATLQLDADRDNISRREYRVELHTGYAEARGSCEITRLISSTCPTSGNVTILQDCEYAPGNYTLGNLSVQEPATVHFVSDVSCSDVRCSQPSLGRTTLLRTRRDLAIHGTVTAAEPVGVGPARPARSPVTLVGNTSVDLTGAVVAPAE